MPCNRRNKKRPCRICRKWFIPDPRVGNRQKTCGDPECKRQWHVRKCSDWNKKHRTYFQEIYLAAKLQGLDPANSTIAASNSPPLASAPACRDPVSGSTTFPQLPHSLVQEVIGAQHIVIIDYLARQLLRSVKEVIARQHSGITGESQQVFTGGRLRGDGVGGAP